MPAGVPVPVGVVGKLGWMPGPASVVVRLWNTSSWSAVQRAPPMKRKRSVRFIVPCPNADMFLNTDPNTACPNGRVVAGAPALPHPISVAGAVAALHAMSARAKVRSDSARE